MEILKSIIFGIIEGITEWLPISSTGHMILAEEFLKFNLSDAFLEMFRVVIQLGAILAVVMIYIKKLWPLKRLENKKIVWDKDSLMLWAKVLVACIPAAVIGILFDDWLDEHLYNPIVVALMLIIYGVLFIIIEIRNKNREAKTKELKDLTFKTAIAIGLFQVLSLIPGTSRSGATILGAILIGTSREVAAEFTFFLAIPVMAGASLLKILKFIMGSNAIITSSELLVLIVGCLVAFVVSIIAIKFLMKYIKKNDFKVFGWYRIVLGIIVLIYFLVIK